jgi:hypothetical protein
MSVVIGAIEGPSDMATCWSDIAWSVIRRHVSRLQTRIVKAIKADESSLLVNWVLRGALSRLEPSAVKVACSVLRGG